MAKTGDCVVKHTGSFATGMSMVVSNNYSIYTCNEANYVWAKKMKAVFLKEMVS